MENQPFFSVIIATYNRSQLIGRALDSLLRQTEREWEAIVIDDDSSDETEAVVASYAARQRKIRYFRKKHSGEPLSKNLGISLATGRFVTFLDSDDEYEPDHLQLRRELLIQNPELQFLYGGARVIGNPYVPDRFDPSKRVKLSECSIGGTFFVERSLFLSMKGYHNILLGADADFFVRAQKAKVAMMETFWPTYVYHHEVEDSVTNQLFVRNELVR